MSEIAAIMNQINSYDIILKAITRLVSDGKKDIIKRSEVTQFSFSNPIFQNYSSNNFDKTGIYYFKVVSKTFMIHDLLPNRDSEPRKVLFKLNSTYHSYKIVSNDLDINSCNMVASTIFNLTDTKYSMIVNDKSFMLLNNLMSNNSTAACILCQEQTLDRTLIIQVKYRDPNSGIGGYKLKSCASYSSDPSVAFEEILLELIYVITNESQQLNDSVLYTFSIVKVNGVLMAVLLPRLFCESQYIVNVWPIGPVSALFNVENFIKNLKIGALSRRMLMKVWATMLPDVQTCDPLDLSHSLTHGITFPQMIKDKVTLHQIYIAYFEEFLNEGNQYTFVSVIPESAAYIKCAHCDVIYANIFGFLRHCWDIGGILTFRCHICNEKVKNLTMLGHHYHEQHLHWENNEIKQNKAKKYVGDYIHLAKLEKRKHNQTSDDYVSKKRIQQRVCQLDEYSRTKPTSKRNSKFSLFEEEFRNLKKELKNAKEKGIKKPRTDQWGSDTIVKREHC